MDVGFWFRPRPLPVQIQTVSLHDAALVSHDVGLELEFHVLPDFCQTSLSFRFFLLVISLQSALHAGVFTGRTASV